MDVNTKPAGKYAVLFRIHFWDDYAERQYQRLCSVVGDGDVFILVDETSRRVPIPHQNVVSHTQEGVLALGLSGAGHGNVLWFNGDYPLYFFYERHGHYGHYIMIEYDVVVRRSLDDIVDQMAREEIDFVGLTKGEAVADWPLTYTCLDAYSKDQVQKRLICIALFSNKAVGHLFDRRLEQSQRQAAGALQRWPYCEGFIPTELNRAGMKMAELSLFGSTDRYDWKPAVLETELPLLRQQVFLHPVLDPQRYVQHTMKDLWPPEAFFDPWNPVARRLRRAPSHLYRPLLVRALWRRAGAVFRKLSLTSDRHE